MKRAITTDLCVIGAGSGGLSVAAGASQLGLKTVLFEAGEMGGDCLNTGCVPSKALIAAGKTAHAMRNADVFGLTPVEPQVDWAAVKAHVRHVIETIAPIDSQERFEGLGVTVIREWAAFTDADTVESESVRVRAKRFVLASGASAFVPPIPGLAETPYFTNETIFAAPDFPSRLILLGGGAIGVELGQAFARLGSAVTIVEAETLLPRSDPEAVAVIRAQLIADGVRLEEKAKAVAARATASGVALELETASGPVTIEGSHLLVAVGRKSRTEGIGLEKAGIETNRMGAVTTPTLRTTNPKVYAVGDVAGREKLTHAAGFHASALVRTLLFRAPTRADSVAMPAAVYCSPELAEIGVATAAAPDGAKLVRWSFEENDRAQAERDTHGFGKLLVGKGGKLLGATIVGEGAADMIHMLGFAMANGVGITGLTKPIAPYPTRGELLKRLGSAYFTPTLFSERTRALVRVLWRLP
jgi:pyruvate/2-oxoglutarate dehydrogenase complex dihydrolipoamide dehydrogenase (E3) component